MLRTLPARAARALIFVYRISFSALAGRACRHLPTCSDFADEAIRRHGLWAGGWMSAGRICRCRPGGTAGFDPAPAATPKGAGPLTPWRYAKWRGPLVRDAIEPAASTQDRAISSTAKP